VIEATPDDRALGPGRLAGFLARCAGRGAAGIAAAVEREAVEAQGGRPRDDVAVVVARVHGGERASFGAIDQGVAAPS
jgi:hypothetical protein